MKKFVIYARVSTNRGEQNIEQQVKHLKEYAARNNLTILKVFKDEESGKNPNRKGYLRMQKFILSNPNTGLLVQDTNRLGRNYYEGVELEKFLIENAIEVISLSEVVDLDSPNGRLMFRIKNALNAQYVEDLSIKRKIGIERAKKEGKYKGRKKGALGRKNKK